MAAVLPGDDWREAGTRRDQTLLAPPEDRRTAPSPIGAAADGADAAAAEKKTSPAAGNAAVDVADPAAVAATATVMAANAPPTTSRDGGRLCVRDDVIRPPMLRSRLSGGGCVYWASGWPSATPGDGGTEAEYDGSR